MNSVSYQFEHTMVKREVNSLMEYLRDRVGERGISEKYVVSALLTVAGEMEALMKEEVEGVSKNGD